jgi:peptide-methionine (S)-S-oxide reductase
VLFRRNDRLPTADEALPGRDTPAFEIRDRHPVLGNPLLGPYPAGLEVADFALGCFWGAERRFWQALGVWTTLVGFQGGHTPHPVSDEIRTGLTGHAETVRVVFDPASTSYERLLQLFWESHDPTQGFRQGNDTGTHCRSAVFTHSPAQAKAAEASRDAYQQVLDRAGYPAITTEILPAEDNAFYPAEDYHQQYLDKNPAGYCGLGGTGISFPFGVAQAEG